MELWVEDDEVVYSLNLLQLSLLFPKVLLLRKNRAKQPVVPHNSGLYPPQFFRHSNFNLNPSECQLLCGQRLRSRRISSALLGLPHTIRLGWLSEYTIAYGKPLPWSNPSRMWGCLPPGLRETLLASNASGVKQQWSDALSKAKRAWHPGKAYWNIGIAIRKVCHTYSHTQRAA